MLHTSALQQHNHLSQVRDRLFIDSSTVTALFQVAVVGEWYLSTHNTPKMRNQYLSRIFPFLKVASGDEVDVNVVPLYGCVSQELSKLDELCWQSLTVSFRFAEYLSCH